MDKSQAQLASQVLAIARRFLLDSGAERAARALSLEASLERDLGVGSLEKAELFSRIEKAFGVQLPDALMVEARQLKDLVTAVAAANPKEINVKHEIIAGLPEKHTDLSSAKTLVEILQRYVKNEPDRPHIYFQHETGEEEIIRYGQLYSSAGQVAQGLINYGLKPSETVAIMLPTSPQFFYAFFGTLLAGGIPVPIYPPLRADQIEEYAKREALILRNAGVRVLITFQRAETLGKLLQAFIPSLLAVTTVDMISTATTTLPKLQLEPRDGALIQYTSGSTGNPKGVLLSHGNLIANISAYGDAIKIQATDVAVSWLPLYHDMGLIGAWLGSLYYGVPLTLMSPLTFLSRPEKWLWAIHYHRATLSAGPNFAYELCTKKIDDADIEGLDLSSWRVAFNGAEIIYPKTMENFTQRFARYGFKRKAFFPVYGLAECSLALAFPALDHQLRIDRIQRDPFEKEGRAVPIKGNEKNYQEYAACGKAMAQHQIRVVDDNMKAVPERMVGNIQFKGPSAMQGYYRNVEATRAIYHEGWWDTGDLGYIADGDLFISGRKKDLIIKAGRNYYPVEIEEIASQAGNVRKGCVAAFGVSDLERGTERLIIVAETNVRGEKLFTEIRAQIVDKVVMQLGIPPDEVILVPPHTIPKTSSGKLRRSSCKQDYLAGKLGHRIKSVRLQLIQLFFQSRWKRVKAQLPQMYKILFNIYGVIVVLLTLPPTWLCVRIFSRKKAAVIFHNWCRWILRLCFCPMSVTGAQFLPTKPMIVIANHASYIDFLILGAVLPPDCNFVGKKELLQIPIVNSFIKHLDYLLVDRLDFSKSKSDVQKIKQSLESGRSIIIFPEGTFSYATGVRPFKSGAFKVAVETRAAICPIAINGARQILRADAMLPQPFPIKITVGEPLEPKANNWEEMVRLREMSRAWIAKHCGEQTIDLITAGIPSE